MTPPAPEPGGSSPPPAPDTPAMPPERDRRGRTLCPMKTIHSAPAPTAGHADIPGLARIARATGRILTLLGGPGIGKTEALSAIAEGLGIPADRVQKINLSGASPAEASGFAVPDGAGGDLQWKAPSNLPTRDRVGDAPFLVMLDEFPDWDPAVQSLWRGAIDPDGVPRIGPHVLPAGLVLVITGNRAADGSRTSRTISAPITSRSQTFTLEASRDEWLTWAVGKGHGGTAVWQWLNFISAEQAAPHFAPPVPEPWAGQPFPTPRAWAAVAEAEGAGETDTVFRLAVEGLVGSASAGAFWAFRQAIHRWSALVEDVRAGRRALDPGDAVEASAAVAAAVRIARRESLADPAAAIHAGALDWLVERFLSASGPERGEAGYRAAIASGIPLDQHPLAGRFTPAF